MMDQSILKVFNLSSNDAETKPEEREDFETGYALVIMSVAIVIGNSLVLITVKSFAKRFVTDIFIFSLALLDIIHTITSIFLAILFKWTLLKQSEEFGTLCKTQAWISVTTQIHSAFIVTVINLERLTAVSRPFFYKSYVNMRRAVKTLILLLLISISISSLPLFAWGNYVLLPKMSLCLFYHDSDFAIIIVVIGYADFLVVSYCFVAIKISLKKFMERQARFVARRGAIVDLQTGGISQKMNKTASKSFIQSKRLLKVTAMVSGLFYISWLPLMISITRAQITHEPSYILNLISSLQPLSSPLVNPLIYFFTWERYKKSYLGIFKRLIACLPKFHDRTMFNTGSCYALPTTIQMNVVEDKIPRKNHTLPVDISPKSFLSGRLNHDSPTDNCEIPTATLSLAEKLGGTSNRDSFKASRCLSGSHEEYCQTKRRCYSFRELSQSISAENEVCAGENVQAGAEGLKSLSVDNLNNKTYRMKPDNHKKIAQYSKVNHGEHRDEVSLKDDCQFRNYVPDNSVSGNKIDQLNNSDNLADKCLITQRIGQYLTNVINDQYPKNKQNICKVPGKQPEDTKRKRDSSRKKSQKFYKYSTNVYQNTRSRSRRRQRQSYFKTRDKFSRSNYLEDFEEFRKKLDEDARKSVDKSNENYKAEIHFHEISQWSGEKDETSEQSNHENSPKIHEHNNHVDKSQEIHDGRFPNYSKKGNSLRKRLELNRHPNSENTEASIWTFL